MSRVDKHKRLRPSILDRLLDDEPHLSTERAPASHQHLAQLRASVKRDLENLLNTRYRLVSPPEDLTHVSTSLMNYGLPDLATVNIIDVVKRREFVRELESLLKTYEPRFKNVKVRTIDTGDNRDRTLRFRIDATLYADPAPEIVVFDSVLDPVSRSVNVEESYNG